MQEKKEIWDVKKKLMLIKDDSLQEHGSVDYEKVLGEWKYWVRNQFLKRQIAKKK